MQFLVVNRVPLKVFLFALFVASITSTPYLVGELNAPAGGAYTGAAISPIGVQVDYNSHLAKMWQGRRGQWSYQLLFTHEAHVGLPLVQSFYVALGALGGVLGLSLPLMYHLSRFILTAGMVLAIWSFSAYFFVDDRRRWLGLIFGTLMLGWSWVLLIVAPGLTEQVSPIEFWLLDAFNLLGALYMPHFAAGIILQIIALLSYDRWVRLGIRKHLAILTIALAAESIIQPYMILIFSTLFVMLTLFHLRVSKLLNWRQAAWLAIPLGIHGALILYQFFAFRADPVWSNFVRQNQTLSPDVIFYILGYLPFIIPIIFGARRFMLEDADDRWWIPILWTALVAALLYGPFPTQRRYLIGVQTQLAVLAAYGWQVGVLKRVKASFRLLLTVGYGLAAAAVLLAMIWVNGRALSNVDENPNVFSSSDEVRAYDWIRSVAQPDDVILSTFDETGQGSGGWIVGATGLRVFIGHWIETVNFEFKVQEVKQFYNSTTSDEDRRDFLRDTSIDYLWYDDFARQTGDWNPADADYLERVFESDTVTIYQVLQDE
ncbi:MAG: hypothetical protein D6737_02385 [Chloroflexi bacterium]|nr:MAG: hypothetical protein CUN54_05195 [Phototrophicales bacterium]RMF82281.1 MAG: hypothetical protein D6737_02385 [Chloroflexota bacterium]